MRRSRPYRLLSALALASALLLCLCANAFAAAKPLEMKTEDERLVKWDLTADSVTSLDDSEIMEAKGNVVLRRGNEYLKADFARYYMSTKWVYLKGNVQVSSDANELNAEEAEFDLRSRTGWLKKGRIFMAGPHAYIAGERIDKHWGDVYTFHEAKVTTCDGDVPAWSLTAKEAVVEIDGYARLAHSSFQVADQPVAYAPLFLFPTKTSRQTGFLTPQYGHSTTKGVFYNQPFFWAIDESNDITFNEFFMSERGFMHGAEYRTRPADDTTGWLRFDWMHDKTRVRSTSDGPYNDDGLIRKNHKRFWLRGMYDTVLPDPAWRFKADLDYVSDQDFLREFKHDFSGFTRSRDELFDLFHRDLREKDLNRQTGVLLTRDWQRGSLALSGFYNQDPKLGNGNTPLNADTTVQTLPQLDAFLYKGRILPSLPVEFEASAQAGYYYRRNGTRGARYQVGPRISLPVNTRYGSVIATAGLTQSLYDTEVRSSSASNGPRERGDSRTVMDYSVEGSTEFARVFPVSGAPLPLTNATVGQSRWTGLRHSVQPRLEYRQRPMEDQMDNPYYDDSDRMLPRTELTYSLTNVLTVKRESVRLTKNDEGEMTPSSYTSYMDLVRLRLEQSYDFREATRGDERNTYSRRPFGDIFSDLTVRINDTVALSTRNEWSPYLNSLTRHQSGVQLDFPSRVTLYAGYDFRRQLDEYKRQRDEDLRYLRFDVSSNVYGPWSLRLSLRQDTEDRSNHESIFSLVYNHQCFQIIGNAIIEPDDKTYQLLFVLNGLGDF